MSAANSDAGKTIECSIENHSRQEECGLERVADDVAQITASTKRAVFNNVVCTDGMNENQYAKFLHLRPERVVFRRRRHFTASMPGDADASKSESLDRFF